jgi:CRISPR-associated exonuclease Cas4
MYSEDELLPLSALQHLLYCERRAALVHIENLWAENAFTVEGAHLHEKADRPGEESRRDLISARAVPLRSVVLGLSGKADIVEFHRVPEGAAADGAIALSGKPGRWRVFPVEYKRGALRREHGYEIQLCAQALCLEEMLGAAISAGAIFFGETRRRMDVDFDLALRAETAAAAQRVHALIATEKTPPAVLTPKCEKCSLHEVCMPEAFSARPRVADYLTRMASQP